MKKMIYSQEVEKMCPVAKGANHGPAPIPEEGKWVKSKEIKDISGLTFMTEDGNEVKAELNRRFTTEQAANEFLEKCVSARFRVQDERGQHRHRRLNWPCSWPKSRKALRQTCRVQSHDAGERYRTDSRSS